MNKKLKKWIEDNYKIMKVDKSTMIWNEWEGESFLCPNKDCVDKNGAWNYIWSGFKYCPYCGIELEW